VPLSLLLAFLVCLAAAGPAWAGGEPAKSVGRGKYLFAAGGCQACHTDVKGKGKPLAGGRKLKTPFGTFATPNITPDPVHGIGKWTDADFIRAIRQGAGPDGRPYYPAFPYPSYTRMTDRDILDLKAYLFSRPPVARADEPHDLNPPFAWRFLAGIWKTLFFKPGAFQPDPAKSPEWNRGAYLVTALGHCGECHTPRNFLGAPKADMALAGSTQGPAGGIVPNITPDKETGIGKWPDSDILSLLKSGMLPDGDFAGGAMGEVIDDNTGRLTDADREAIILYLKSVPAVSHRVEKKAK